TYTIKDGLPDDTIADLLVDHTGALWMVAGVDLAKFENDKFTVFKAGQDISITTVQRVSEDGHHVLWVGGFREVVKRENGRFVSVLDSSKLGDTFVTQLVADGRGDLWIGGSLGLTL